MPPRLISMLAVVRRRRQQYQSRLMLQSAHPRNVHIEDEAPGLAQVIRTDEIFCRSRNLRPESFRAEEFLQRLANRLVIVDNRDERRS